MAAAQQVVGPERGKRASYASASVMCRARSTRALDFMAYPHYDELELPLLKLIFEHGEVSISYTPRKPTDRWRATLASANWSKNRREIPCLAMEETSHSGTIWLSAYRKISGVRSEGLLECCDQAAF